MNDVERVISIAKEAGEILKKYHGNVKAEYKAEGDPVTIADKEADALIRKRINDIFPGDKILSEENKEHPLDYSGRVWIVDPLDGTKRYVAGEKNFCTIIGLCEDGKLVLGVVYAPLRDELYYAERGKGAFFNRRKMRVSKVDKVDDCKIVERGKFPGNVKEILEENSAGLKIVMVAKGKADLYYEERDFFGKWDVCGAELILREAGGELTYLDGSRIDYTQDDNFLGKGFLASNAKVHNEALKGLGL